MGIGRSLKKAGMLGRGTHWDNTPSGSVPLLLTTDCSLFEIQSLVGEGGSGHPTYKLLEAVSSMVDTVVNFDCQLDGA